MVHEKKKFTSFTHPDCGNAKVMFGNRHDIQRLIQEIRLVPIRTTHKTMLKLHSFALCLKLNQFMRR